METSISEPRERAGVRAGPGERLGDALMNAVEDRRTKPAAARLDWGARAFVAAMEGHPERGRAGAHRPRLGAALAATALCAAVAIGAAAWPALMSHARAGTQAPVVTSATPAPGTAPANPAPLTFDQQQVIGPGAGAGFAVTGQWSALPQGGAPDFEGPTEWTTSRTGTATWTLGPTSCGKRWDKVRVQVWIPGQHAGAWVAYTVVTTAGASTQSRSFSLAQQTAVGWVTLPGTFVVGTATQRTGSIRVRMTYLRPYVGPAIDTTCTSGCTGMAAGQVAFQWS